MLNNKQFNLPWLKPLIFLALIMLMIPLVNGELLLTDPGEDSFYTEDSDHYSGNLSNGNSVALNTPAEICGHYGLPVTSAYGYSNKNSFIYYNGNSTGDGLTTGVNDPVYTATLDGTQTYYAHVAEGAWCANGNLKPYRFWSNGNYTPPSGQLLLPDPGEDSFNTEYSDHYSGNLSNGNSVMLNTPAVICGHYGLSVTSAYGYSNKNSFIYYNGNSTGDGLTIGPQFPIFNATLDGTQTYYKYVAEGAWCANGNLKPYRFWSNGNYTPPSGQLLLPDPGEDSYNTEYNDHYSGVLFCGNQVTENTPSVICGHYGLPVSTAYGVTNKNSFIYYNGNSTGDGSTTGVQDPVYTPTLDCSRINYAHVAEGAWCANGNLKPYRFWNVSSSLIPLMSFSATPLTGPANLTVTFRDTSTNTPTSWSWRFGDGTTSTSRNVTKTYTSPGLYTINHSAKNVYGTGWSNRTAYINVTAPLPVVNFTGTPTNGDVPLTVQFTETSTNSPTSWYWVFGDGTTSTDRNVSHTYAKAGNYSVSHSATNAVGTKWMNRSAYIHVINLLPAVDFTATPTTGTKPLAVQFTDISTNSPTTFFWSFGDGTNSTSRNKSHTYTKAGTYTVSHSAKNSIGTVWNNKTDLITISGGPVANFTGTPLSGTSPLAVQFTDRSTNTPTSWLWTFGDGVTATTKNPSHTYASPGTYTVSLRAGNAEGNDTMVRAGYVGVTGPVALTYSITVGEKYRHPNDQYQDPYNLSFMGTETGDNVASILNSAGWSQQFYDKDLDVTEEDFGTTGNGLDNSVLHYHFGHGNEVKGIALIKLNELGYYPVMPFDYLSASQVNKKWGNQNKWVILDNCLVLSNASWGDALVTTHGILGFASTKTPNNQLPVSFFHYAMDEDQKVKDAWFNATTHIYSGTGIVAAYRFDTAYQRDHDHLPGHGEVAPDENPDDNDSVYWEWPCY